MKDEELKNKTESELESEIKKWKGISGAIIGVSLVLMVVTIYGMITKGSNTLDISLLGVAFACFASVSALNSYIKKIKIEISSRKNNS
ncbi:hypothetical protein Q4603_00025 [Zobellia galactanivorans]|uniref:hypothetical protein n=1 Tax=Zobellia galactanivorans (strain DSM 12802 / CCUG 47099 / CIP 106680 / NCIMB 13871 / Dsij) TaxID=63186 RepID=UPI0026E1BD8F|nr:hypothetical protein [Zobellia galactanivorans]MDO6806967.1 hypothetical protein [Zobellia galactanivorans]